MKALILTLCIFFISCKSFINQDDAIQKQGSTSYPGCEAATDFKQTLESILSSDIEAEEESSFTKPKSSSNKTATITHTFTSKSLECNVNSKLIITDKEKGKSYTLLIYLSYGTRKDGSKESITIKSYSPSILLEKAFSIIDTKKEWKVSRKWILRSYESSVIP